MGQNGYSPIKQMFSKVKAWLFWVLIYFFIGVVYKLIFLIESKESFSFLLFLKSIWFGLRFDVGLISILFSLSVFVLWMPMYRLRKLVFFFIHIIFAGCFLLASVVNIKLYASWGAIFNLRAAKYLLYPRDILALLPYSDSIFLCLTVLSMSFLIAWMSYRLLSNAHFFWSSSLKSKFCVGILWLGFSFFFLRGGLREIPTNPSDAFFSNSKTYNISAINPMWNVLHVFFENQDFISTNPYLYFTENEVTDAIKDLVLTNKTDSSSRLFSKSNTSPNIVLVVLEGVNAELIQAYNSDRNDMPFLNSLSNKSYAFTKAYATGFRTEQGLAALYSGLFSSATKNITDDVNRLSELKSILSTAKKYGYATHFYFGGNIEFANTKAYLISQKVSTIIEYNDWNKSQHTQQLGVDDSILLHSASNFLAKSHSPFFTTILTQSTHEPYDISSNKNEENEEKKYINACKYVDKSLKIFFENEEKSSHFKNTIYIVTSDHAHRFPGNLDIADPKRYHIPFLIYSALLRNEYRGYKDTVLFKQNNFPATLSFLLGWKEKNYSHFSTNHFSDAKKYRFSCYVNGFLYQDEKDAMFSEYYWSPVDKTKSDSMQKYRYPLALMQRIVDHIREKPIE
jgi:phosphoglycerol transferase MdoB-like AlkP superfamily enzyme